MSGIPWGAGAAAGYTALAVFGAAREGFAPVVRAERRPELVAYATQQMSFTPFD